ncbi:hypothetical protein PoB_000490200 [Plakobranchus ocellatus]|uniref:Uncharacterized protein n=1 Tax=Plakobranchus ocellatus TaxID=259542 RepID=A0AAV3Y8E3_9GAST|nr:hypothetical protein PoB_000490200 [Plakobranchus ocellatus]
MGKQNQSLPEHPHQPELLGESGSGDTRLQDNNALSRPQRIFSRAILTSFFLCTACHISHTLKSVEDCVNIRNTCQSIDEIESSTRFNTSTCTCLMSCHASKKAKPVIIQFMMVCVDDERDDRLVLQHVRWHGILKAASADREVRQLINVKLWMSRCEQSTLY